MKLFRPLWTRIKDFIKGIVSYGHIFWKWFFPIAKKAFWKFSAQAAWPLWRLYVFVFRPKTCGVKCLITCQGKILLIQNSYGPDHWNLPGGGVKRKEHPEDAAKREVLEEVGIDLASVFKVGEYINRSYGNEDRVVCFVSSVESFDFKIDETEIKSARWFKERELPFRVSSSVLKTLEMKRRFEADRTMTF